MRRGPVLFNPEGHGKKEKTGGKGPLACVLYTNIIIASETDLGIIIVFILSRTLVDGLLARGKGNVVRPQNATEGRRDVVGRAGGRTGTGVARVPGTTHRKQSQPWSVRAYVAYVGMQGSSRPLPSGQLARGSRPEHKSKKHQTSHRAWNSCALPSKRKHTYHCTSTNPLISATCHPN